MRASTGSAASPSKRPREREGSALDVLMLGREAASAAGPVTPDLSTFLAPVTLDAFKSSYYRRKALAIKAHPSARDQRLEMIAEMLHGLNPRKMLEGSNSEEGIMVWMVDREGELKSIKTNAASAQTCYQAGHALYFRGTEELESSFVPGFSHSLGCGFAKSFRDGARRGEIEVFAGHAGHKTTWHWDFQENFTVQLRGRKKWQLAKSGVPNPHRACAMHFAKAPGGAAVLHAQHQLVRMEQPGFTGLPADIDERSESVVLQPGDVLYHPAGWWHQVEALEGDGNSLSINVSLFPMTWAELAQDTIAQVLLRRAQWRERINFTDSEDAQRKWAERLATLAADLEQVKPNHVVPPAVLDAVDADGCRQPTATVVLNSDGAVTCGATAAAWAEAVERPSEVMRSPLAVLSATADFFATEIRAAKSEARVLQQAAGVELSSDDEEEAEDSDEEGDDETELPCPEGFIRFDIHSNFVADEAQLGAPPAVQLVVYVAEEKARTLTPAALLPPGKAVPVKSLGLPKQLVSVFIGAGYLAAA